MTLCRLRSDFLCFKTCIRKCCGCGTDLNWVFGVEEFETSKELEIGSQLHQGLVRPR